MNVSSSQLQQWGFITFLAIFLLFASHYLQINSSGTGLQLPFNTMGWIPLSFVLGLGLIKIGLQKEIYYSPLLVKLLFCVILLFLPFLYFTALTDNVIDRFLGLLAGFFLLVSLQQFARDKSVLRILLLLLIVAAWIEILMGWDQFYRSNGMSFLGNTSSRSGPITGIFQQRNVYASFLAFAVVLSGYVLSLEGEGAGKRFRFSMLPLLCLPLVSIHLLNATYSRTGWLGLFVGVALILPLLWQKSGKYLSIAWFGSFLLGFLLSWNVAITSEWQSPSLDRVNLEGLRQAQLPQLTEMFLARPLQGYGYGQFESAFLQYNAEQYANGELDLTFFKSLDHPHNELLLWAIEGGVVALAALLLAAWFVWKRVYAQHLTLRLALIGLFFPIVLHTQLEFPFYVSVLHWFIFIVLIFIADNYNPEYKA